VEPKQVRFGAACWRVGLLMQIRYARSRSEQRARPAALGSRNKANYGYSLSYLSEMAAGESFAMPQQTVLSPPPLGEKNFGKKHSYPMPDALGGVSLCRAVALACSSRWLRSGPSIGFPSHSSQGSGELSRRFRMPWKRQ